MMLKMTNPSSASPTPPPGMPPFARRVQPATAPVGEPVQPSRTSAAATPSSRGPFRIPHGPWGIPHGWWVLICLLYILSPVDLVPEIILGPLGLVDDIGLLMFGVASAKKWWQGRSAAPKL